MTDPSRVESPSLSSHVGRGSQSAQRARHQAIAEAVIKRGSLRVEDLVQATGVSLMTVYRDVAALEEAGIVQRQRGQVLAVASSLQEASAGFRLEQNAEVKASMSAVLAPLVKPGSSLMLDDSTSGVWLLRALEDVSPLTVVTNSLLVAQEVERRDDLRLIVAGGEYQAWAQALMGPTTVQTLSSMNADMCVLSASGVVDGNCMHPYGDVVSVKQAMLAAAATKVLMLDHTKFRRQALHSFARLADFDVVVVDAQTPQESRQELQDLGVQVLVSGI
ncbi:DeoR family transcriptional regulator [Luteococcus japonicus]|uniref:Glycerol-3-phosphate regulon repressor, DeoR family n=2 Tax=Luteococcus japonicus TaxID=33984 RepID=A0A1R4J1L0_9ACTN|nr:DeoR/GlpR family DNA-binding transcription regulator [Luteococcus japonicus]ROR54043.1 DeoR family transcriptional regulator [Luteococcus japonicus]SJN25878.1 Glycerol-3-phosphate regulon repressor, DeoR family [Luteococcus japonicus LSP_Lj1]